MTEPAPLGLQEKFVIIPLAVLYHPDLTGEDVRIYGSLYEHGYNSGSCFPGRTRLARLCHVSERTLDGCVQRLETAGFVKTRRRWKDRTGQIFYEPGSGRAQTSTEYMLVLVRTQGGTAQHGASGAHRPAAQPPAKNDTRTKTNNYKNKESESDTQDRLALRGRYKPWTPPADAVWSDDADGWVLPDGTRADGQPA